MDFFGATNYMVKLSRKLKVDNGILPEVPALSKKKIISEELKSTIKAFYESDKISRQCHGKKDYVSVINDDGHKVHVQKRLVLSNLKEVFHKFKEFNNTDAIGYSSFCALRPKHCVLAGAGGTHSVCVCTYHQNSKLMLNSIGQTNLTLNEVLAKAVCQLGKEACMMRECKECPGKKGVVEFLQSLPALEGREVIKYKKWITVDRCRDHVFLVRPFRHNHFGATYFVAVRFLHRSFRRQFGAL